MSNKKGFNMTHAFSAKDVDLANASTRHDDVEQNYTHDKRSYKNKTYQRFKWLILIFF